MKKSLPLSISILTLCLIILSVFGVSIQRSRAAGSPQEQEQEQEKVTLLPGALLRQAPASGENAREGSRETSAPAAAPAKPNSPTASTLINSNFEPADPTVWLFADAATNKWKIGTATNNGGTQGAYVTNDNGVTNAYTNTVTTGTHIYTSVTFPAGETAAVLTFDWKGIGEHSVNNTPGSGSSFDYMRVSVSTSAPTAGTLPAIADQLPIIYNAQSSYVTASVRIPAAQATGTKFIIISWVNDSSGGANPPGAIDNVTLVSQTPVPLTGTKTIGGGGDYPNFNAAIANLNANGVGAGGVTFNVAAGSTFTETPSPITATGTAANPIIFQKTGAGANPLVTAMGTGNYGPVQATVGSSVSATGDAVITIAGGDFITFNGIDAASANFVAGITAVEYGYLIRNASTTDGALNNTVQNTNITLNRTNTAGVGILQSSDTLAGGFTPASTGGGNSFNHYYNLNIQNVYSGIYLRTLVAGGDTDNEVGITGAGTTVVGGATAGDIGAGALTTWGIRAIAQTNVKIFKTEVRNVSASGSIAIDGIFLDQVFGTNECFANQVHDIKNTSTSAVTALSGIKSNAFNTPGPVIRVYNNFIWNITSGYTGAAVATRQIKGISVQSGGTGVGTFQNIDFNSVRLDGSGSPNISSSAFAIGTTSGPTMNVRNNIFANVTGAQAGVAKHYTWESTSATLTGIAGSVSDHNDLYIANATNGFIGLGNATDRATITDWRTATGQDFHSKSSDPQFNLATDLHINPAVATEVESAGSYFNGAITWVPQDIDMQARNATFPDIGADEGTFTAGADTTFPDIFFTAVATSANTISRTLTAKILDPSGVPTTGTGLPVLYFRKGAVGLFTAAQGVSTGSGNYDFTITYALVGGVMAGDVIQYYFVAQDNINNTGSNPIVGAGGFTANPPTAATPPTTPFSYTIGAPFTGAISVGTTETIMSLTNAGGLFAQINAGVITGNLVVSITSNLGAEAGTVALNQFIEEPAGSNFTITIKPSGGARTITGTGAGANLIKLNGADRVTIDGSLSGGTDRSLTITNPFASTTASVVWLASVASPANGANNNTVKNCIITGATPITTNVGLGISGSVLGGVAEAANSNNTLQNNAVTAAGFGIFAVGPTGNETGNLITRNDVGSTIAGSKIGINGIAVFQQANATVSNNTITGVVTSTTTTTSGIRSAGTANGVLISGNRITDVKNTNATGFGSNGIQLNNSVVPANVTVANNFISDVASVGFNGVLVGDNGWGIIAVTGGGYNIYDNSVNLATNETTATSITAGINITSAITTVGTIDLRGNIFSDTETVGTRYGIYCAAAANVFSTINFNDYFAQNVGFLGVAAPLISDWRTATGQDVNSISADPLFTSATDLHIPPTSPVVAAGTPIGGITTDIDSDPRPAANPDIGADELVQAEAGVIPGGTFYNALTADGNSLGGNVSITNVIYLNGKLSTGANTLGIGCNATISGGGASNYVIGNLKKTFCAAGMFNFVVGTANGFSPVTVNITAGTFPADFTTKAVQGPQPNFADPTKALQRYWTLTATGVTADLMFNYLDPPDVPGTANENNFVIFKYNGSFSTPGGTVNTVANTATITGVSSFSDWTLAEPSAEPCPLSTTPTSQNFAAGGGSNSFMVTADGGCSWTAVSNNAFIMITPSGSGTGNGTVNYSVAANTGPARMGTVTIGVKTFTVTQDNGCSYMLDSSSHNFNAAGGSSMVAVTTAMGCGWTAVSNDAFIIIDSGTPGSGNGTVNYHVGANTGPMRTGTMTIAGITFTVTQDAGCSYMLSSNSQNFIAAGGADSVNVTTAMGCTWTAVSNAMFIMVTGGSSGSGNGTVNYSVAANTGPARMGTMTIAGITFTVTQDSGCMFTLSRNHQSFPGGGGSGSVDVTASDSACPWTASTAATFIHITSGTPGTGNGTLQYTVDANATVTIRNGTITIAGQTYTVYQGIEFIDVPPSHDFYTEIGKLAARGVTLGCNPVGPMYCPSNPVLREQMAAFLMRALGEFNPPPPAMQRFGDVPPSNDFYAFIERLAQLGITLGCQPGMPPLYCPTDPVKREQMSAFILRALGEFNPPTPLTQRFGDVPPSNDFYNFIDRLAVLGITLGCQPGMPPLFCPNDPVSRGQMAAFLVRAFDL